MRQLATFCPTFQAFVALSLCLLNVGCNLETFSARFWAGKEGRGKMLDGLRKPENTLISFGEPINFVIDFIYLPKFFNYSYYNSPHENFSSIIS